MAVQPPWAWPLIFSFMIILQTVGLLGRVISSSQGLYLKTGQHEHRINTYTYQTSVPYVGFKPMIPVSERESSICLRPRKQPLRVLKYYNYICVKQQKEIIKSLKAWTRTEILRDTERQYHPLHRFCRCKDKRPWWDSKRFTFSLLMSLAIALERHFSGAWTELQ
jgi:hypothetical protein